MKGRTNSCEQANQAMAALYGPSVLEFHHDKNERGEHDFYACRLCQRSFLAFLVFQVRARGMSRLDQVEG